MSRCELCGEEKSDPLFKKRGRQLVVCRGCGLIRVDPMLSLQEIAALYAPSAGYQLHRMGGPTRYSRSEEARDDRLGRIVGAPPHAGARLLDVGSATGGFLIQARSRGWKVQGLEIGEDMVAFARKEHGLQVELGAAEEVVDRFGTEAFDVITLWDVIEHLPRPLHVMRELRRALKPGGRLYLATPNADGWVAQFHKWVFKPLWGTWPHPEPPRHLYQFSRRTMRRLCDSAGFGALRFLHDEIPLWYTSGFQGEPGRQQWMQGESGVPGARSTYFLTGLVFLAARIARRGDSMIVCGSNP